MKKIIIAGFLFSILSACTGVMAKADFVGIWKSSSDNAVIKLNTDGTYIAKQVDIGKLDSNEDNGKAIDFSGKWQLVKNDGDYSLRLHSEALYSNFGIDKTYIEDGKRRSHKIDITFEIQGGTREKPLQVFTWIGDPDDMHKYEFIKAE
ncbi:DUF2147 domain-containing protein [Flavobacterium pallidum]|uniref:Lipocalin-like domain-containing protein n=1 Tax=Flavobacterium pallidum TaxID=2172098 RepID=A0A2S1SFU7_9FLAO|nr:hypothetical protein [Flavobacterium pallidum]AWI25286.1 hypothetical protein HYN49_04890 [Flavobacterium pallidum]